MKIAVFDDYRIGLVQGDQLYDATDALLPALGDWPRMRINRLIAQWDELRPVLEAAAAAAPPRELASAVLLPANPAPLQLFAAPANYRKHIGELGQRSISKGRSANESGFFMKAGNSVLGAGGDIVLPVAAGRRFDHESELAVVIGKPGRDIPRAQAMEHVFGYSALIDVTLRIEPGEGEEERVMRKSFRTFTPLGPYLVTRDEIADPQALDNRLWVNGELRQSANTGEMIVDIAHLIELISSVVDLNAGDVIATGTPQGVGPIEPGDQVAIEIEGVGRMTVGVVRADAPSPRGWGLTR